MVVTRVMMPLVERGFTKDHATIEKKGSFIVMVLRIDGLV